MKAALDQENDFFREYSLAHIERRIQENGLDAQFDKRRGRLVIEQEPRIRREKLLDNTGSSPGPVPSRDSIDEAAVSKMTVNEPQSERQSLDLAELDRDDNE